MKTIKVKNLKFGDKIIWKDRFRKILWVNVYPENPDKTYIIMYPKHLCHDGNTLSLPHDTKIIKRI